MLLAELQEVIHDREDLGIIVFGTERRGADKAREFLIDGDFGRVLEQVPDSLEESGGGPRGGHDEKRWVDKGWDRGLAVFDTGGKGEGDIGENIQSIQRGWSLAIYQYIQPRYRRGETANANKRPKGRGAVQNGQHHTAFDPQTGEICIGVVIPH